MMTPEEFRAALEVRGLNQPRAAKVLGVHQGTISKWARGVEKIPRMAELAVLALPFPAPGEPVTQRAQSPRRRSAKSSKEGA